MYIVQCTVNVHSVDTFYIYTKARLNSVTTKKKQLKGVDKKLTKLPFL